METYLDDANFYDLRIVSTMGLTDEDVEALRQVEGVRAVQPAYSADLLVNAGADVVVSRVQSLPPEGEDAINHVVLADGRWPEKSGECVVEAGANLTDTNYPIGTQLTISSENEDLDTKLACTEYTVVGIVHNANYFSFEREPASVGNGTVDLVMYLQPEDFAYETYTEIYVTAQGALEQNSMGDAYEATVEAVEANVEAIQQERCEARYAETRAEGQQEIDDAWAEYYDAEAEAQQELADAAAELEDGRKELADGEQEYWDGEQEYADGVQEVADNEATVNDGDAQLEDGRQELLDNQAKIEEGEAELAANAPKLEDARRQLEAGQAEYESGLEQYNEALQKLTDGEEALAAGKKQLDAAEEDYAEGLAQLVQGINLLLQTQNPEMEGTVSAEDVQGFIDWLLDNELPTPESYDEALDDLDAYLAPMGLSAADLSLTSAAREVQQKAQQMLDDLMAQLPPTGGEEESASESDETVQAEPEEEPSETPAPSDMAEEEPAEETNPDEPETEGKTLPEAPAETAEETAEPEIEEAGQEEAVQEPAASEKGAPAEEAALQEMTSEPQAATDSEAAPAEAQPCTEEAAPKEKAPQQTVVATGDQLAEEEQMQQLIQQLTAIVQSDRSQMADTLAAAQNWLDQQAQPWPGAVTYFAKLVAGGQQGLETEQEKMGFFMEGFAETVDGRRTLDTSWEAYYANEKKLSDGRKQLEDSAVQLRDAQKELEDGWAEYRDGVAEYEAGKKELADGRVQLEDGWATLTDKQIQLDDARRQLEDAKAELADARAELDDARATIAENAQKLRDGEIEYEDAKAEAEQELADARAEIEDGQRELDDIEMPEWYIWDRSNNVSFSSFTGNVDKLTAITTIFPVFFFLVAALVVSTTMTRMVEEERLQIGTMKALGYTRREIMQKYLWYAFAAAVSGTVVGLAIGFKAFPTIIWSAYTMMYYMPELATPWRLTQALFAGGTLTVLTVGVTALACRASLSEVPASLMLPRAPKAGKRILLERITPLWRRFLFTWKVTCRNLLRYKRRFWMTVIGVAGCTSLLVAGFGISDSLNAIITRQFSAVSHYDLMTVVTKEEALESGTVYDYLTEGNPITESLTVSMETTRQSTPEGDVDVYLMVPQDVQRFANFLDLHERVSGKAVPLGEEGVVLTEKLAKTLGVQAGDTITLTNGDEQTGTFTVSGVCEHYISNYVYMSAATYEAGFGTPVSYNAALSKLTDDNQEVRDAVSETLLAMDNVASLTFTQDSIVQVLNMLNSIDAVVVLIIVCAASLAFVVLYNLSNINIAERVKEIATIKVLGFYDREVNAYVNRESVALTLIGTLFGVFGGIALHRFIIVTVEVDAVMFGRDIQPLSFVYAIALTLLFSTLVNLVMQRSLRRISMVESMKAPE